MASKSGPRSRRNRPNGLACYRSLPAGQYPHLVGLADALTSRTAAEEFEFGLECLLDGVDLRLQRAQNRRRRQRNTTSPA